MFLENYKFFLTNLSLVQIFELGHKKPLNSKLVLALSENIYCHAHKCSKTSIGLWISTTKITQNNLIQSRNFPEAVFDLNSEMMIKIRNYS